jgi:cytochrome b6-f complex iron-sulfur subunit
MLKPGKLVMEKVSRRQFAESLGRFTLAGLATVSGSQFLASCSSKSNPAAPKEGTVSTPALTVDLNQVPELKTAGGFKNLQINSTPIVVINAGNNTFKAFSLICTHQGCTVAWTVANQDFECPCHGSKYDSNGKVTQGPAPSPLRSYTTEFKSADNLVLVYA